MTFHTEHTHYSTPYRLVLIQVESWSLYRAVKGAKEDGGELEETNEYSLSRTSVVN